jgi:proteasome lid subunit RPN8/RPN11
MPGLRVGGVEHGDGGGVSVAALAMPVEVAAAILAHARAEAPIESCGLLSGPVGGGAATRYHPARNAASSGTAYDLDGEDLVRIVHAIERDGEELVGIVHSHPRSPAVPSPTDVRSAGYRVAYVIASLADPAAAPAAALRAWRIADGSAVEMPIRIGVRSAAP